MSGRREGSSLEERASSCLARLLGQMIAVRFAADEDSEETCIRSDRRDVEVRCLVIWSGKGRKERIDDVLT